MQKILVKLWQDDCGALISIEWVFVATILVLGVTIGLATVRNAALSELLEFSNAVMGLQQCYSFSGKTTSCGDSVCGSAAGGEQPHTITLSNTPANMTNIDVSPCGNAPPPCN